MSQHLKKQNILLRSPLMSCWSRSCCVQGLLWDITFCAGDELLFCIFEWPGFFVHLTRLFALLFLFRVDLDSVWNTVKKKIIIKIKYLPWLHHLFCEEYFLSSPEERVSLLSTCWFVHTEQYLINSCLNHALVLRVLWDVVIPSLTYLQLLLEFIRGVGWPHTFQCLYEMDSGEDVGEIKLCCIVWECQDLWPWFHRKCIHLCGEPKYPLGGPRGAKWGVGATGIMGFFGQN